jgi:hypothetical protein
MNCVVYDQSGSDLVLALLTETIFTAKWFWSLTHGNQFHCKMVLEYNSRKPFSLQNGFGVQLTETISTAKWF